ncbi:hypothetical protein [Haloferax sp. DFSO60]|uniref:DUF7520 family protein n=1 Tax=Haloferax sp. DFSO60 TaxID=3388652 RepID=UPI00397D9602
MSDRFGGRRILLLVGLSVVAISGILGLFIGENGKQVATSIDLYGIVSVPTTPLAVSLYGIIISAVALGVLFGLVEFASRWDEA